MSRQRKEKNSMMRRTAGFTLLETMLSLAVLAAVSAVVMSGMTQMMRTQGTVANRTEMHTSVRNSTELLQQEIGQAGKVSLTAPNVFVTLGAGVVAGANVAFTLNPPVANGSTVYPGEVLTFDVGANQEVLSIGGTPAAPKASFTQAHNAGVPVAALGAFATGIVPPGTNCGGAACGSTGTVLKMYGDINGDGNMVYVEYTCTNGTPTAPGFLYRNTMAFDAAAKPGVNPGMALLNNVLTNPNTVPCFNYGVQPFGAGTVVTDVAVTLTVQTPNPDPSNGQFQVETKALLNVSPRNIFEVWDTSNLIDPTRAQAMPPSVTALLP